VRFNPMSYGVDGLRYALAGVSQFGVGLDLVVLAGVTAVFSAIGAYLFDKIQI